MHKKILYLLIGILIGLLSSSLFAYASEQIKLIVNGKEIQSDVPPIIINGRTLCPIRPICEALGATVNWDQNTNSVIITTNNSNNTVSNIPINNVNSINDDQANNSTQNVQIYKSILYKGKINGLKCNGIIYVDGITFGHHLVISKIGDEIICNNNETITIRINNEIINIPKEDIIKDSGGYPFINSKYYDMYLNQM